MPILTELSIRNFKCFRSEQRIPLTQGTYLVGKNNSGKTAVLEALHCFFENDAFDQRHINRTELAARKEGFNRSDIGAVFDLTKVSGKARQKRMIHAYSKSLTVKKQFTWREISGVIIVSYTVNGSEYSWEDLPKDISELLASISISYIHPQEGAALLEKAQEKFKQRLFHNWGRHASVAEKVKRIEDEWELLRATANSYLSAALSSRLKTIWKNAEVKVDLPASIQDIVAVSDISFRSSPTLPQISLTSHGTGAQSAILYQTHYILDSDRTLHQGQYYPIWLLEEPESFLHADIAFQLARLLSSEEWLGSIQMVIATHSPIILAGSTGQMDLTSWAICDDGSIEGVHPVKDVTDEVIDKIGMLMGDGNFGVYFHAAESNARVFLEDSRIKTAKKVEDLGVTDPISLNGVTDIDRYLRVLVPLNGAAGPCYFIADYDKGSSVLRRWIDGGTLIQEQYGWRKIDCGSDCFLVLLPEGSAIENIFAEWTDVLDHAVEDLYDGATGKLQSSSPMDLTRAAAALRKHAPNDREEGRKILSKEQDVKDRFWATSESAKIIDEHANALLTLLGIR